ncbi:MAG: ComF family protein [Acidobacteriota bacterium]|nr:ComF family protein [Acidobacteriota bacterium]
MPPGRCGECRARRRPFRMAVAAAPYEGAFRRALLELKFRRREVLAELLAKPAVSAFRRAPRDHDAGTAGAFPAAAVAVPVPFWRGRRRGFNQAELLARPVAREFGIPLVRGALRRRSRPPQTLVSPSARRRNVRGAFRAGRLPERLAGRPLLLVDDVFTTGSTVEAAVRALIRAGAGPVDVLTVARAPR